jgi:eukaryotic-like serine/threonine-protein kinase
MEGNVSIEAHVKLGQIIADKYRVEERLGMGGMGAVFAATHLELEERVAIKFLLPSALESEATVKRFSREARAAVKIKSEHVVRVLDVGKLESGLPYFVMELCSGQDLETRMAAGRLEVGEVVDLVLQAARGIAEAHAAGIVHRDLKPANLFVTKRRDGSTCVKVLDFGISKSVETTDPSLITQTSAVVGSPAFMSPEQWLAAKDVDARADIWALGAIMYRLFTERTPFDGETVAHLCAAVLNTPPRPLRETRPDVPERLEAVILRCLAKDRKDRFRDVGELAYALEPFAPPHSQSAVKSIAATVGSSPSEPGILGASRPDIIVTPRPDPGPSSTPGVSNDPRPSLPFMDTSPTGAMTVTQRTRRSMLRFSVLGIGIAITIAVFLLRDRTPKAATPTTTTTVTATAEPPAPSSGAATASTPPASPSAAVAPDADAGAPIARATTEPASTTVAAPTNIAKREATRPAGVHAAPKASTSGLVPSAPSPSGSPAFDRSELGGRH